MKYALISMMVAASLCTGCAMLPKSGPTAGDVAAAVPDSHFQVIDVDAAVVRDLLTRTKPVRFSDSFGITRIPSQTVNRGDVLEVSVWEAPPAVLFNTSASGAATITSSAITFPLQMVDSDGTINVPFAGHVVVAGKSVQAVEADFVARLTGKANQPQVIVRLAANNTAYVTVVGDVAANIRMPLTPRGERLLDALAVAGGPKASVDKMTLQVTRGDVTRGMPLDSVIRDPAQNILLQPGDVVTALFQPLSFTALGATGRSDEINYEAKGISLAQALARAGGVNDNRADAAGVFIFRLEPPDPKVPLQANAAAEVPVIYRVNLKDPRTFFVAQNFPIQNRDVLYVANAPATELQKFLNLVVSTVYPIESIARSIP
jgi:polysaccharide export outer membrane protein